MRLSSYIRLASALSSESQEGFVLPLVIAGVTLGTLVVFSLLSFTTTAVTVGGQDVDAVLGQYAAEAGVTNVVTDLMDGKDALGAGYVLPTSTVNGIDVDISVTAPTPATMPQPLHQYIDPGVDFGLVSLDGQTHYYFQVDSIRAGTDVRANWSISPANQRWKMKLYKGQGPPGAPAAIQIAADGFESSTFDGGSGAWLGSWSATAEATIVSTDGPYEGTYHLRLEGNTGLAKREVDVTGLTDLRLRFYAKSISFETGETATVSASTDDISYTTLRVWRDGEDDNVYRTEDLDLSVIGTSTRYPQKVCKRSGGVPSL